MRNVLYGIIAVTMAGLVWNAGAQTAAQKKKAVPQAASKSTAKTAPKSATRPASTAGKTASKRSPATTARPRTTTASASKAGAGRKTGATTTAATRRGRRPAPPRTTWRNRQTAPSPDRYKEIQQALAAKGYLSPEDATGAWNQASIDALRKFQGAQNLEASGKINSLSLIALGLGPKHETATVVRPSTVRSDTPNP